ncbi:spermidine synthase [Patescibacteria group bacterium]
MKVFEATTPKVKVIDERQSIINKKVTVVRSFGLGTYIQVEGLTQSGGVVTMIWNSTLKEIKRKRKEVNECLILGMGGGSVSSIVSKLWPRANQVGVDIDPVMIEFGKKHLKLDDERIQSVVEDAGKYTKREIKGGNRYDLVIVDVYVGYDVPDYFTKEEFIKDVKKVTKKDGIAIFNRLYFGDKRKEAIEFGKKLEKEFNKVDYLYPEANLMLICHN